jgi:hypothetical protein
MRNRLQMQTNDDIMHANKLNNVMSAEQPPQSPEQEPYEPTFDLERLSTAEIVALHASLEEKGSVERSVDQEGGRIYGDLSLALCADIRHLTERNLDKAREVFHALAHSDHLATRSDTATMYDSYLAAEAARGEQQQHYGETRNAIRLWVRLTDDEDQEVAQEAADAAGRAIRDGTISRDIAAWMIKEAVDGRWNWDSGPLPPCKAPWWAADQAPSS